MGVGGQRHATPRPLYPRERPGTHCTGEAGWALEAILFPAVKNSITFVQVTTTSVSGTNLQRNISLELENRGRIFLSNVRTRIANYTLCQNPQHHNIYLSNRSSLYYNLNQPFNSIWFLQNQTFCVVTYKGPTLCNKLTRTYTDIK